MKLNAGDYKVMVKRKIRKLMSKTLILFKYNKYYSRNQVIISVYTMGKVGSSTVMETLFKYYPLNKIFHLHFLSDEWLKGKLMNTPGYSYNLKIANEYFTTLNKQFEKRIKIITLVRDPVSRDISEFFQNFAKEGLSIDNKDPNDIVEMIKSRGHDLALNWFESEFNNYLKINIYDFNFDREKGFSTYCFKNFDLLIIQVERLNSIYKEAFKHFLGVNVTKLLNSNETKDKYGIEFIKKVKNNYFEDKEVLSNIYNSKYCKHFYNDSDLAKMKSKWFRK